MNIISIDDNLYKILRSFAPSYFKTKSGEVRKEMLGVWVEYLSANKVVEREGRFLICRLIEEAIIVDTNE